MQLSEIAMRCEDVGFTGRVHRMDAAPGPVPSQFAALTEKIEQFILLQSAGYQNARPSPTQPQTDRRYLDRQ